jgi:LysM repeat protein
MKRIALHFSCIVPLLLLSGCAAYLEEQQLETARQRTEVQNQRTDVDQLKSRIEALEKILQDQDSRMAALSAENDKQRKDIREQLAAMDRTLKAYEASREADKQEIINDLTAKISKIADMMRPQTQSVSSRPVAVAPSGSPSQGREHLVQAGETLSAIATAYKVKVAALVQANNLKSADSLRVGQRLVIPE